MNDILLTGFMGTGKSTVGRVLADRYGLTLVDTDEEITRRTGKSIPSIFQTVGESGFRDLEADVLRDLVPARGRVVATGGGALVMARNRELLREDQRVFCLTCDGDELERRLENTGGRPLLSGPWRELLQSRQGPYAQFEQIDTTGCSPDDVAREIASRAHLDLLAGLDFEARPTSAIHFERGVAAGIGTWLQSDMPSAAIVVTDECVRSLGILSNVEETLRSAGCAVETVSLPVGEATKSPATLLDLYGICLRAGLDRGGLVVGIGGGVIGDLAGMLAATYMRGVRLVLVPTTLLAQVDAAIGGKVGVDAHDTKNLVGAFHPACHVAIDPDYLVTLSADRLSEGLAEVVKIALMRSPELLERVQVLREPQDILGYPDIVRQSAAEKITVVSHDPYEQGERALLNFGHTIGHGIEAASQYRVSHGHAVALGMIAEARIGQQVGVTERGIDDLLVRFAERFHWPATIHGIDSGVAFRAMLGDKKRRGGLLHVAIPEAPGAGRVVAVGEDVVRSGLQSVLGADA